jgi:poly-gamma-glutamate capsule biosynthesis protein CapA/YwtB (metallophosphatase superfamily)
VALGDRPGLAIASYGARYPRLSVASALRVADVAIANLECSISTRGSPIPGKQYTFRGAPSSLREMARYAGVDLVTVANNHALDYGRLAFADTLANAHRLGMTTVGGGRSLDVAYRPAVSRLGGIRAAFLGSSDIRPPGFQTGSNVVLGAYPHVLQPIGRPRTRRLVAWTLGNFVFGANSPGTERTGILRLQVGHSGVLSHRFRRAHIGGTFGIQPILD